jgi:hypothetical protein
MKQILSKILYYVGDFISRLLYFNCLSWLYPIYNKIMLQSARLDRQGKVWKFANDCPTPKLNKKQIEELTEIIKKTKLRDLK